MTKRKQEELEAAFTRAIAAVKTEAIGPKGEFYPTLVSGKKVAKMEPVLRRRIAAHYSRNLRKYGGDETKAINATLEEMGGPYSHDHPPEKILRRQIVSNVSRHVSHGIGRRFHKKRGNVSVWSVRNIEAWRDGEGGWTWNNSSREGDVELPKDPTTRDILKAMRDAGHLSEKSRGAVRVENMGEGFEIQAKSDGEPLYALEPKEG
jgi:hypothetical protein